MLLEYFTSVEEGLLEKRVASPDDWSARKTFILELVRLGKRLYSGEEPVAWCGVAAPFDLLNSLGVTSCFIEFVGAMLASVGAVAPYLQMAEQKGHGRDTCGFHRAVIGAAHRGQMPVPEFLVATSTPCTAGMAAVEELAAIFDKPLFVLQVPQTAAEENVAFLADQLRALTAFAENHLGRKLDAETLRDTMQKTNEIRALMLEMYQLARHVPSPANGKSLRNLGFILPLLMGRDEGLVVARARVDELARRVKAGQAGVPGEKTRLLWVQTRIQYRHPLLEWLEKEHKASIVVDELNDVWWDPIDLDDPYSGMARRTIGLPLNGPASARINRMLQLAREYRVDGVINPCHWGCRQGTGVRGLVQKGFASIGLPVLNLETDCADPRNFSEGQVRTRIEAFLEMLGDRE